MEKFKEALERGKAVRKLQDEILALFVRQVQGIDDKATLEAIKQQLQGGIQ